MKKLISLLLAATLVLSLAACGASKSQKAEPVPAEKEPEASADIQVDEGLFNVDVTLGAALFQGQTEDAIKAAAKENGYSDCKINADGSVTYTMTKNKRDEMLADMKTSFEELVAGYLEGENAVASFSDIQYNDDFSKINIYVDAEQYTMWDSLYALTFYASGAYYQAFAGVANDDVDVVVNFIDDATSENLETSSYKDFIVELNSETDAEASELESNSSSADSTAG